MPSEENRTFVIKNHLFDNNVEDYHSVIFLVRNPYDAYIANFNRVESGNNHVGLADARDFAESNDHFHVHSSSFSMTMKRVTSWSLISASLLLC